MISWGCGSICVIASYVDVMQQITFTWRTYPAFTQTPLMLVFPQMLCKSDILNSSELYTFIWSVSVTLAHLWSHMSWGGGGENCHLIVSHLSASFSCPVCELLACIWDHSFLLGHLCFCVTLLRFVAFAYCWFCLTDRTRRSMVCGMCWVHKSLLKKQGMFVNRSTHQLPSHEHWPDQGGGRNSRGPEHHVAPQRVQWLGQRHWRWSETCHFGQAQLTGELTVAVCSVAFTHFTEWGLLTVVAMYVMCQRSNLWSEHAAVEWCRSLYMTA